MSHPNFEAQLDAFLDGELATTDAREIEAHVAQCEECRAVRNERLALRTAIKEHIPSFQASAGLRERVRTALRTAARPRARRRFGAPVLWRSLALAASFAIVAFGSWTLALQRTASEALATELLASHIRSLMPGHLADVPSSDQHTVRPWFNGKLDFSPPVYDFAGRGYPLIGGRLDYVAGRTVAALVYGRRQHVINVFLWPAGRGIAAAATATTQGYHVLQWTTPDFAYCVVSDLGMSELQDFAQLLRQADSTAK